MQSEQSRPIPSVAISHGFILSILCGISYWLITRFLAHVLSVSHDDDVLGGMWAVASTIFVYRHAYEETIAAALSRISATMLSFVLCFAYLSFFPFKVWAMAALIGIGAIIMICIGRRDDVITTGITTAVVMIVASMSPEHAWKQPILRVVDTLVGTGVGILGDLITSKPVQGRHG